MADSTPKAWLCKHCNERVDPTMAWCWNCGCGKDGEPIQDLDAVIEEELRVKPTPMNPFTSTMQDRGTLLRLFFLAWGATGLIILATGTGPLRRGYASSRGSIDELVVLLFHISLLITFFLIANRLLCSSRSSKGTSHDFSYQMHRPWVRGWMTRGWGSVFFWFAWLWLLLGYI